MNIPKKKATVVGKSKLPLCLALTAAFAAVYFYVALPAINLHDESFYTFFLLCVGVFCVLTLITGGFTLTEGEHFTLTYSGEAPQVDAPANLTFTDGGGILVFTAQAAGEGTLFLRRGEVIIATYRILVRTKAETHTHTRSAVPLTVPWPA